MLRMVDRFSSGNDSVDLGIIDLALVDGPGGERLFAYSGANGGLSSYGIGSDGRLTLIAVRTMTTGYGLQAETDMAVAQLGTSTAIVLGLASGSGLVGWSANLSGGIGTPFALLLPNGFTGRMVIADQPDSAAPLYVLAPDSGRVAVYDPGSGAMIELSITGAMPSGTHSLVQIAGQDQPLLLAIDAARNSLTALRHDTATNSLRPTASLAASDGLAVATLSDLDVVTMGGQSFVIAAAAGTSSLTVIRLSDQGQMTITDHLLDSRDTRFASVCAVDTVTVNGQVFVAAGGGDDGVTLFRLLPDGTLQTLATLENSLAGGLANVTAVKIIHSGERLFIIVGGETEIGLTVLEWPLGSLGDVITGAGNGATLAGTGGADILTSGAPNQGLTGGGGDDVLIAETSGTRLTGGAGRDTFVLRDAATLTTITDFQRGADALDLTGWPMLRDTGQLTVTPRSDGITLSFNGRTVTILASDDRPLTLAEVLPVGLGPARIPVSTLTASAEGGSAHGEGDGALSPGAPDEPGGTGDDGGTPLPTPMPATGLTGSSSIDPADGPTELSRLPDWSTDPGWQNRSTGPLTRTGTQGDDTMTGASGADSLDGGAGNDLIYSGLGNDTVFGLAGDDFIFASGGNNQLWGGLGNDVIRARDGHDLIGGGAGHDLLDGGNGQNTIWGGSGNDTLLGGDHFDTIGGGPGNDLIFGFAGDDDLFGASNHDTLHGGSGHDTIWGGPGNDVISGGPGNDLIASGAGTDHVWGNDGADTFLFYRYYKDTFVHDFSLAEGDQIQLTQWMFRGTFPSGSQIAQHYGSVTPYGIVLDFGLSDTIVHLLGVYDLQALESHITVI
ncbi:calcium-binding protein [Pseudotabrizicola formosa]|uniref:calcium-binding protein n=1 Tax=Pseudotabrizicola formosa TaxID=2030009 RepID=UPI00143DD08D|nr:calcium-binding protein [Pseudotabrizicola formosa]